MPDPSTVDQLADYLAVRDQDRRAAVERLVGRFAAREMRLIREAAVMGYVQGAMNGPHRSTIPRDGEILREVIEGCLSHPDLYPTISGDPT